MTYATIFSGIGGWEIGMDAAGWQLRWQCECDRFCCAVLGKRFGVPVASDVHSRKLFKFLAGRFGSIQAARVDCIVGSPPCQPFSVAGQKHGVADRRHLYPAFIAAVRILRPRWVLMENVSGLLSDRRAFGQYIGGLVEIGFDCVWHSIPACAVGANHQRDRLWIIAQSAKGGSRCGSAQRQPGQSGQLCETVADTERIGGRAEVTWREAKGRTFIERGSPNVSDTTSARCKERQKIGTGRSDAKTDGCGSEKLDRSSPNVSDTAGDLRRASGHVGPETSDGRGDGGHTERERLERWRIQGPAFRTDNWAVEPDVGRVAHGVPARVDRLKALGNAVVPQIPFLIAQAINQTEKA